MFTKEQLKEANLVIYELFADKFNWTPTDLDFEDMMSNILNDYTMLMKLKGNVAINVLPGNNLIIEADSV